MRSLNPLTIPVLANAAVAQPPVGFQSFFIGSDGFPRMRDGNGVVDAIEMGMLVIPPATAPGTLLSATETYVTSQFAAGGGFAVGQKLRCCIDVSNAATAATTTVRLKFGANKTTADSNVFAQALGAGTAAAGRAMIEIDVVPKVISPSGGVLICNMRVFQTGTTGFTNAAIQVFGYGPTTLDTASANALGVSLQASAANVVTVQSTSWELVNNR